MNDSASLTHPDNEKWDNIKPIFKNGNEYGDLGELDNRTNRNLL